MIFILIINYYFFFFKLPEVLLEELVVSPADGPSPAESEILAVLNKLSLSLSALILNEFMCLKNISFAGIRV